MNLDGGESGHVKLSKSVPKTCYENSSVFVRTKLCHNTMISSKTLESCFDTMTELEKGGYDGTYAENTNIRRLRGDWAQSEMS